MVEKMLRHKHPMKQTMRLETMSTMVELLASYWHDDHETVHATPPQYDPKSPLEQISAQQYPRPAGSTAPHPPGVALCFRGEVGWSEDGEMVI